MPRWPNAALPTVLFILVSTVLPASAQVDEKGLVVTPFITYIDAGSTLGLESEPGLGLALAGALTPFIQMEGSVYRVAGAEYELVQDRTTTYRAARFATLFNFNRPNDRVQPYLLLGLGWLDMSPPAALDDKKLERLAEAAGRSNLRYNEKAAEFSDGTGLVWGLGGHVFLSEKISLRLDLRWFTTVGEGVDFTNFEPSLGLSFWTGP